MTFLTRIQDDPAWIPHGIDAQAKVVEFIRVPDSALKKAGFLFEFEAHSASDRHSLTFEQVLQIRAQHVPLHFIFHSAFCRSTLLARALNVPGKSTGLSEPGIFAAIANAGDAVKPLVPALLSLLAKPRGTEQVVFAKPTNHANRLIPLLLSASPSSKAILMTNDLPVFLKSVRRRGLLGRRWGRELFLEMQSYAGMDFQMSPRESFAMTDMQAAGLAWFLNQNYFHSLSNSAFADRLRILNGDRFNDERAETLQAALSFTGVELSDGEAKQAASSAIFDTHAKLGGQFSDTVTPVAASLTSDAINEEEAAQVSEWLSHYSRQIGLELPLAQNLT